MANSKEVGDWLLANSKHLKLKVTKGRWVKEWIPGYSDIHVQISVGGITSRGNSIDRDPDMAFVKASVEAIERVFCIENNIPSNGVAAHVTKSLAQNNASNELIERDSFLNHFIGNVPFLEVNDVLLLNPLFVQVKKQLSEYQLKLNLYRMKTVSSDFGFVCVCTSENPKLEFSSITGFGHSQVEENSFYKALFECLPNIVWFLNNQEKKLSLTKEEFFSTKSFGANDHKKLYLGKNYQSEIKEIFKVSKNEKLFIKDDLQINIEKLESSIEILQNIPVKVYRAISSESQKMYYGPFNIDLINIKRLEAFSGRNFKIDDINTIPHCVG